MSPARFHEARIGPRVTATSCAVPPEAEIHCSLPFEKNPIRSESGDQKGKEAPTVLKRSRSADDPSDRTHSWRTRPSPTTAASCDPPGEIASPPAHTKPS